jgi:protein-tyrosine phosphatase
MKILFVCLGNICRSPIAEGVMRHLIATHHLDWQVDSAGTESYHIGKAPHQHSQAVCKENGIDISLQKARKFVKEDLERYDKIYALASDVLLEMQRIAGSPLDENKVMLFLNEQFPGQQRSVSDPWYGDKDGYYPVFAEIKSCCEAIVSKYAAK